MLDRMKVLQEGDRNGNHRVIRLSLPTGREIFGLATENAYGGGWDLGPTWNYLVGSERPFLIDTGRKGMGGRLLKMMELTGRDRKDLSFVLISHGHEDHDGGLAEIVQAAGVRVLAHPVYGRLIHPYPAKAPSPAKASFPASCWHCFMPESHVQAECLEYHRQRDSLVVQEIEESDGSVLGREIQVYHLPGHAPDALAVRVGREALIVGDVLLPDISPHPTREASFRMTRDILPRLYYRADKLYGLRTYIRSLKRLNQIGCRFPEMIVLPAHRLFYQGQWNVLDLASRVAEVIELHIQRCAAILAILKEGPKTVEEIAREHFDPKLLKGLGIKMAVNEILSHGELLEFSRDVRFSAEGRLLALGSTHFESVIRQLPPFSPIDGSGPPAPDRLPSPPPADRSRDS